MDYSNLFITITAALAAASIIQIALDELQLLSLRARSRRKLEALLDQEDED